MIIHVLHMQTTIFKIQINSMITFQTSEVNKQMNNLSNTLKNTQFTFDNITNTGKRL